MCGSQTFAGNQQTVTTTPIPLNTSAIGTQTSQQPQSMSPEILLRF